MSQPLFGRTAGTEDAAQYAQKYKEQKLMGEWLEELKKTIYVEIKL